MIIQILCLCSFIVIYNWLLRYTKKNILRRIGIRVPVKVVSVTKTNLYRDEGSFASPVIEITFEWDRTPDKLKTASHVFNRWEDIPNKGDTIILLVHPTKPDKYCVSGDW